ncbi:MAG: GxxExxY protein [Kiritimatiellaceae bacterium]|nr:GxxExxY protein [Kiritimatiellaceae bacterium]
MTDLVYEDLTYKIRGVLFEVYKEKGCGFLEGVYQECLEIEFELQNLEFKAQQPVKLSYKGRNLRQTFVPDFIICDKVIMEIKATKDITAEYRAQVQNYLKATGYKLALLVNFGHYPQLQIERFVN